MTTASDTKIDKFTVTIHPVELLDPMVPAGTERTLHVFFTTYGNGRGTLIWAPGYQTWVFGPEQWAQLKIDDILGHSLPLVGAPDFIQDEYLTEDGDFFLGDAAVLSLEGADA